MLDIGRGCSLLRAACSAVLCAALICITSIPLASICAVPEWDNPPISRAALRIKYLDKWLLIFAKKNLFPPIALATAIFPQWLLHYVQLLLFQCKHPLASITFLERIFRYEKDRHYKRALPCSFQSR
jgi:hypothetical protein